MTGMPIGQGFAAKIEELGGDDWVFDQIADGKTWGHIAEQVGCSRSWISSVWVKMREGRRDRLKEARKDAAPHVFDDGGQILEDLAKLPASEVTPAKVQLGRARADHFLKRAAFLDPESFGEKPGVQITVDIGQLHLDALRAKGSMTLSPTKETHALPAPDEDDAA